MLALPGMAWLALFFLAPLYVVLAVVFGGVDPVFRTVIPVWNPLQWSSDQPQYVVTHIVGAGRHLRSRPCCAPRSTCSRASVLCLLIAFPIAYYVARLAGPWRGLLLALLIAPFWISYMMRMLAWVNLLANDGLVNRIVSIGGFLPGDTDWLSGHSTVVVLGLVYGYVPYMIIPLYAGLDRLPSSLVESARDLGASRSSAFLRVTLPMARPIIVASVLLTCLPMLGDYFTSDLLSGSPRTSMVGNLINETVLTPGTDRPGRGVRAARAAGLAAADALLRALGVPRGRRRRCERVGAWWRDPWRKPRVLAAVTIAYLLWSLLPVLVAVLFSFNAGRSRTSWQGFSMRWYYGDPFRSVWHDDTLQAALVQTLKLGVLVTLVTVPLGVALAIGLDRWHGRLPSGANAMLLLSFVLPETLLAVALLFVVTTLVLPVTLGTSAQVVGLVTFQLAYPAILVRARLATIGVRPRGGGDGPRGVAAVGAAPGDPADAGPGDRGQRRPGVRRRDRRLRHRPLPLRRLVDRADVGEDLQHRPGRPDTGAQRPGHADARRGDARGRAGLPGLPSHGAQDRHPRVDRELRRRDLTVAPEPWTRHHEQN